MKDVAIFINSYNRLLYLKLLIKWLEGAGHLNIIILDNNSTYPPLLSYLNKISYPVLRLKSNMGYLALYRSGFFNDYLSKNYYVFTDDDIIPTATCPLDAIDYFKSILDKYPHIQKCGFGLKIDDLPDEYRYKEQAIATELASRVGRLEDDVYLAKIDTTFCLYKPHVVDKGYLTDNIARCENSAKTDEPYVARHGTFYIDSSNLSVEEHFYQEHLNPNSVHWSKL